ncbi:hypothetical protein AMJ39_06985 [candidate division TA06 bacterium DG_24]|uniref:Uncharacterized protein n=3 Tax=Bacteria division TA06 TaxID=1156500 RepID=A0A0S8JHK4_UNCT6|nr:MAG: hypothetical protein AMJ39_06985 [candidate division TA06 bacterium DG_24]KPK68681.1 MAG: hypothetical protein AMJ82_07570 [candidate division TA06 bacterium SM23_40]KPL09231.1 MAG: hypothetical protein AMJ71_06930 [candidate division TA06 bacterium SM1_40]
MALTGPRRETGVAGLARFEETAGPTRALDRAMRPTACWPLRLFAFSMIRHLAMLQLNDMGGQETDRRLFDVSEWTVGCVCMQVSQFLLKIP